MWLVMATGKVKWFNGEKGFGFIAQDGGGDDVFVHFSTINSKGYRSLNEGDEVELDVERGPKGYQMANVEVTKAADPSASGRSPDRPSRPLRTATEQLCHKYDLVTARALWFSCEPVKRHQPFNSSASRFLS